MLAMQLRANFQNSGFDNWIFHSWLNLQEGFSDGGIVVEDCLKLMLNLLRNNSSNQTFFREGSYIQRISVFFDLNLDEEELEVGWAAQKVSNMLFMLSVVRTLVSPSNPTQVRLLCYFKTFFHTALCYLRPYCAETFPIIPLI